MTRALCEEDYRTQRACSLPLQGRKNTTGEEGLVNVHKSFKEERVGRSLEHRDSLSMVREKKAWQRDHIDHMDNVWEQIWR